ncbi:MAG: patatin-like phospholipase family protein [Bacteroidota bacterium]|nr:patatin-like phospholipase family protein [Bacteroidota bacterium]
MRKLLYFFPIQLLLHHIKRNYLFLIFWTILFSIILESFGVKYGIPYLFLAPEYLSEVNFLSFFLLGLSVGIFIMAFHIASYIIMGYRFRFIATLSSAFFKFCINNATIPLLFLITFGIQLFVFYSKQIHFSAFETIIYYLGFLIGNAVFILFSVFYFNHTNKSLFKLFGIPIGKEKENKKNPKIKLFSPSFSKKKEEKGIHPGESEVRTYLYSLLKIRIARKSSHYNSEILMKVLNQHHHNAAFYLFAIFGIILLVGIFRDLNCFMIPAASSIMLLLSMVLMIISAIHSWFRGWSIPVFILLILGINYLTTFKNLNSRNHSYGLNYDTTKVDFNKETVQSICADSVIAKDKESTYTILENWNKKNKRLDDKKPKMILVNCSGGGMRASFLSFHILNLLNKETNGDFFQKTQLISGSSGGMIGAAYFRELILRKDSIEKQHYDNISSDMLNSISFTITVNDILLRLQKFSDGKYQHTKDRGFAFEYILHKNTDSLLVKSLGDYYLPEKNAEIPMLILSPTIINNGMKMNISSQQISYLTQKTNNEFFDGIEFSRLFAQQDAKNLNFTSALRMNATIPYISPVVYLPSSPMLEIMDAGLKDNLGTDISMRFIQNFKNWITENTSGIILVQIRSNERNALIDKQHTKSFLHALIDPFLEFNRSWGNMRDLERDKLILNSKELFNFPLDVISISLPSRKDEKISLSWRLMKNEKEKIENVMNLEKNKEALKRLKKLLN